MKEKEQENTKITNIIKVVYEEAVKTYKKKDFTKALALFYELFKRETNHPGACYLGGVCAYKTEQWEMAKEMLLKTIEIKENYYYDISARIFLAIIYIRDGKWQEAKKKLDKVIKDEFPNPIAYSLMGYMANKEKKYEIAEKMFKKSINLDKENPSFNNNLGFNYLEWDERYLDKAKHYISIALRKDKNNHYYLHSMGQFFFANKEFAKASRLFRRSLNIVPEKNTQKDLELSITAQKESEKRQEK